MRKLFDNNNVILINEKVLLNHHFVNSCKENTHAFIYNKNSTRDELISVFDNKEIDRLAFVFDETYLNENIFINNEPFFTEEDLREQNIDNLSSNFKFIVYS